MLVSLPWRPCLALLIALSQTIGSRVSSPDCRNSLSARGARAQQWPNENLERGGWRGTVLSADGKKVYGIPTNASQVLEVTLATRKVTRLGNLGPPSLAAQCNGQLHCGLEKWIDGVLAPNGNIIGIPYGAESVLEIDPANGDVTTFGVISSPIKRKWLGGVVAKNGLIYAMPYDAESVLEINPNTRALALLGHVGAEPCKWYGAVLGPNEKVYGIPYAARFVLEVDVMERRVTAFAEVPIGWGKWAGGVLARNGMIYALPALASTILEIDVYNPAATKQYGMLPSRDGEVLTDKWNGGVVAPNGRVYGIPWRTGRVLEFDPQTKAISLLEEIPNAGNFSWQGGVVTTDGVILAVPYNAPGVLEISNVCPLPPATPEARQPESHLQQQGLPLPSVLSEAEHWFHTMSAPRGVAQTFLLAMLGCPEGTKTTEDMCFHVGYRLWHSAMITIAPIDSTLSLIREKVSNSGMVHMPSSYCFLFKGHPLDPNMEATMPAAEVATKSDQHMLLFVDAQQCGSAAGPPARVWMKWLGIALLGSALLVGLCMPIAKHVCNGKRRRGIPSEQLVQCVPISECQKKGLRFFACIPSSVKAHAPFLSRGRAGHLDRSASKDGAGGPMADRADVEVESLTMRTGGDDEHEVRQQLLPA